MPSRNILPGVIQPEDCVPNGNELYRKRQPTISEHQQTIAGYLRLRSFDDVQVGNDQPLVNQDGRDRRVQQKRAGAATPAVR